MTTLAKKYTIQTGDSNPILRTVSEDVEKITNELKEFCADLIKLMRRNK